MPKIERKCKDCAFYSSYYHTGNFCFWSAFKGVCSERNEVVNFYESCNSWSKEEAVPQVTPQIIDKVIGDVQFIIKYFNNEE